MHNHSRRKSFLFATLDGGGSVPPVLAAVSKLLRQGHRVRVMSDPTIRSQVDAIGAEFVSWIHAPHRIDRLRKNERLRDWEAATPQDGVRQVIDLFMCGPALLYAQDLIAEFRREPADLIVSLDMLFGAVAAGESLGAPLALFSPNLNMFPMAGVPPFGPGFKPAGNAEERAMHAAVTNAVTELFDSGLPALNAARAALRLPPLAHVFDQIEYAKIQLLATGRAFDFAPERLPKKIRYVGPQMADPGWTNAWSSPWPRDDSRPLVLVSFSTTFQNHAATLQRVIDALATLPVRALITLGGVIDPGELQAAENTLLMHSAPHSLVMREATLVITHGGHGTVMTALCHRLPLLILPHGRDQNDNAIRVTERGAGLALLADSAAASIREATTRLLFEASFAEAARRLGDAVAAEAEQSKIVEYLEAAASE